MRKFCSISVALSLVVAGLASLGCGAGYGSGNVYVGVGVGPYVGHPYPYRGGYGGWVGRPYPGPYRRYEDPSPSELYRDEERESQPSDSVSALELGQATSKPTANQGTRSKSN
jgi:hypothetical protein